MADNFAKEVRELFAAAEQADDKNREEALMDLEFAAGEQWDSEVRAFRETPKEGRPFPLPCLTVNTLPQQIGQVIGDRRANQTAIKVLPREDGDKKVAEVRSELIRGIELQSKAQRIYSMAFEQAVTCGQGALRVDLDYAREDAFERDLFIRAIPNPMAVLWDPLSGDPTGRDAKHCFVSDKISKAEYKRRFPKASETSLFDKQAKDDGWCDEDSIRLTEFHEMFDKERTLAMLMNEDGSPGPVEDVTDKDQSLWLPRVVIGPNGKPVIREKAKCPYTRITLTNGMEQLEEPTEFKLHRLTIIRVMGREVWIGDKRVRFGLVRFARDPQRLKNYFRSVRAELLMLAPRHNFIAPASAVKNRDKDWPNTLVYNDGASAPPQEVTLAKLQALLAEEQMCAQDIKDTTGIHDASLGIQSNETSGVAIARRQAEGDNATIIYHDNMNSSQQEVGEVLNSLIPQVYDTVRTIRTLGNDDSAKLVKINDPQDPESVNLVSGRYDVDVTTGPSYQTRRTESVAQIMELASRAPQIAQAAGDLIINEMDLIRGEEIAERIKRTIPPNILGDEADEDADPQAIQQKQIAAQKQEVVEQLEMQARQADTNLKVAQAEKAQAEARKATAEAEVAEAEMMQAMMGGGEEGPDPIAAAKLKIDYYNAQTNRAKLAGPLTLPPEGNAVLVAAITDAVMQALGKALPPDLHAEIASSAFDKEVANDEREQESHEQSLQPDPEPPAAA